MTKLSSNFVTESSAMLTPTSPQVYSKQFAHQMQNDQLHSNQLMVMENSEAMSTCSTLYNGTSTPVCADNSINWFGVSSLSDTPNSARSSLMSTATEKNISTPIFNFEPDFVKNFNQQYCDHDQTTEMNTFVDIEYINYNENNRQMKIECDSPDVGWTTNNRNMTKPMNLLPPISSFNDSAHGISAEQNNFDVIHPSVKHEYDHDSMENFNFDNHNNDKASLEDKVIWDSLLYDSNSIESPTDNNYYDQFSEPEDNDISGYRPAMDSSGFSDVPAMDSIDHSNVNDKTWTCQWENCYLPFNQQCDLVRHIEGTHIEARKGDVFSCYWLHCARQYKPFNARYKLLIHMRVHSGEKPNKCQVNKHTFYDTRIIRVHAYA